MKARIREAEGGHVRGVARVDQERCIGCFLCRKECPEKAIDVKDVARVEHSRCTGCGACVDACPEGAISIALAGALRDITGYKEDEMPGYDGSGPMGMGPMTGGGRGYCTPGERPAGQGPGAGPVYGVGRGGLPRGGGRGRAWGGGRGRGRGRRPGPGLASSAPWTPPGEDVAALEQKATFLEEQLNVLRRRIAELEKAGSEGNE